MWVPDSKVQLFNEMPTPQTPRLLTKIETISFLYRLKQQNIQDIASIFDITIKEVKRIRKHYDAYSEDRINNAIRMLESQVRFSNEDYPYRNYKKQETCEHNDFTVFLKCKCSKVVSENNLDEIIEICQRKKAKSQAAVRVFSLSKV